MILLEKREGGGGGGKGFEKDKKHQEDKDLNGL